MARYTKMSTTPQLALCLSAVLANGCASNGVTDTPPRWTDGDAPAALVTEVEDLAAAAEAAPDSDSRTEARVAAWNAMNQREYTSPSERLRVLSFARDRLLASEDAERDALEVRAHLAREGARYEPTDFDLRNEGVRRRMQELTEVLEQAPSAALDGDGVELPEEVANAVYEITARAEAVR